ncbi:MAG TPA: TRAP transporter TatT component family protein [Vicinamibacterales bacterium]|nr:TRAP transporter TatT component family protein [Vicinamibacterales bacterium]
MHNTFRAIVAAVVIVGVQGCALKRAGFERMADAISATASAFARDSDPEFVRAGVPSTLKMVEMLLDEDPRHPGLLLTACSGFTQYAYAFLQVDAELLQPSEAAAARELTDRAARMYDRARGYCVRRLDVSVPGAGAALSAGKADVLLTFRKDDVGPLYWTAVSWGGSVSLSQNPLLRIGELAAIRGLLRRALELDPAWGSGAIHEAMIALEGLPAIAGGSAARARSHFEQAVALSEGQSAFAYVSLATSVAQPAQDRAEFERLLKAALAIDVDERPALRLSNLIAQKRARFLLGRSGQLF